LAWVAGYVLRCYARTKTVNHPSTNLARLMVLMLCQIAMYVTYLYML